MHMINATITLGCYTDRVCQHNDDTQLSAIARSCADECQQWVDRAVCLSTNNTTESSGCRIPVGTDVGWVSESRTSQSANEYCSADGWPTVCGQCYVPWRSGTTMTRGSLSVGTRTPTRTSVGCRCILGR